MNRILGVFAFLGLILSLAVHVSALLGIDVSAKIPFVWLLHIGVFLVFVPFVFASRKVLGDKPTLSHIRTLLPSWVVAVGAFIVVYAMVNFLLFFLRTQGGNAAIQDGHFVLLEHGRLIRELSESEYTSFRVNHVRGFSGHWLALYYMPFAYFMFSKKPNP